MIDNNENILIHKIGIQARSNIRTNVVEDDWIKCYFLFQNIIHQRIAENVAFIIRDLLKHIFFNNYIDSQRYEDAWNNL